MNNVKQQALLAMARAYYDRGVCLQYDQRSMDRVLELTPRRRKRLPPEAANSQEILFLDCSGFASSVYYNTFGYMPPQDLTWHMADRMEGRVYYKTLTGEETEEQKIAIEDEIRAILQPGDMIVYARTTNSGHVFLYLEDGECTDCTCKGRDSYDYNNRKNNIYDRCEIWRRPLEVFFDWADGVPLRKNRIFDPRVNRIAIIRPMDLVGDPLPQAMLRIGAAKDLRCEVTNSAPGLQQAWPGGRVDYRVTVKNLSAEARTAHVTFCPPAGSLLVEGTDTRLNLAGGEEAACTFTVQVEAGNQNLWLEGPRVTVNGLEIYAYRVLLGKEPPAWLAGLCRDVAAAVAKGTDALEAAARAYGAFGIPVDGTPGRWVGTHFFLHDSTKGDCLSRQPQQPKVDLTVYSGFGGAGVITPEMATQDGMRMTLITRRDLQPGDLILCSDDGFCEKSYTSFFDGEALHGIFEAGEAPRTLSGEAADAFIDSLFGRFAFVVLRPWQAS